MTLSISNMLKKVFISIDCTCHDVIFLNWYSLCLIFVTNNCKFCFISIHIIYCKIYISLYVDCKRCLRRSKRQSVHFELQVFMELTAYCNLCIVSLSEYSMGSILQCHGYNVDTSKVTNKPMGKRMTARTMPRGG